MQTRGMRLALAFALVGTLLTIDFPASAAIYEEELPAPFSAWAVEVIPDPDHDQIYRLVFDSEILHLRATSLVWLPDAYVNGTGDFPVLYYLHGTIATTITPEVDELSQQLIGLGVPLSFPLAPPGGPAVRPTTGGFHETLDEHSFVVVAPDAGAEPWCPACNWANGPEGKGVEADRHVQEELIPLVEAVFRARSDRAGRAVAGHSMGGGGAIIQGFRHPDRFAFIGSSSGTLNVSDDPLSAAQLRWLYWNRTQGFDPPIIDEISIRNFNATDLAPNLVGVGTEVVAVVGDGCLTTSGQGSCAGKNPTNDTVDFMQEIVQRYLNNDLTATRLIEAGVPLTYIKREGHHGIFESTFRRYFLPRLNELFERDLQEPRWFSYKTADRRFTAWGYDIDVSRANDEFTHLLGADREGRRFGIAGSGRVRVTTPPSFDPGETYGVAVTKAGAPTVASTAVADAGGRLTITVSLPQPNAIDEREIFVDLGLFQFPQVRVEVDDQ